MAGRMYCAHVQSGYTPAGAFGQETQGAGCARAPADRDGQFPGDEAQTGYFTRYVRRTLEWMFATVCTDEGLLGLNVKKRGGGIVLREKSGREIVGRVEPYCSLSLLG